jgi:hypothetical protein
MSYRFAVSRAMSDISAGIGICKPTDKLEFQPSYESSEQEGFLIQKLSCENVFPSNTNLLFLGIVTYMPPHVYRLNH